MHYHPAGATVAGRYTRVEADALGDPGGVPVVLTRLLDPLPGEILSLPASILQCATLTTLKDFRCKLHQWLPIFLSLANICVVCTCSVGEGGR
jgi:hypothetical protein